MELELKNIGIIKDSLIKLDGLTVITGKNNSGKSTVGKALFSIIDSVEQMEDKALNDRIDYTKKTIEYAINKLQLRYLRNIRFGLYKHTQNPSDMLLEQISYGIFSPIETISDAVETTKLIVDEIHALSSESVLKRMHEKNVTTIKSTWNDDDFEHLEKKKVKAISILEELILTIQSDPDLVVYSNALISKTLLREFHDQVHPVKSKKKHNELSIVLRKNGEVYFDIKVTDNNIDPNSHSFISCPFQESYLIDNAFVIDGITPPTKPYRLTRSLDESEYTVNYDMLLNSRTPIMHNEKLRLVLSSEASKSIVEENIIKAKSRHVMKIINNILPGNFKADGSRYVYNDNDSAPGLNVENLAAGSKMFAIIKLLIEKGSIGSGTMLILDEPEIHLHPEWQNIFAEVLVLLVKEAGINILLTTHSPNFLLAIEVYTKKYSIKKETNYYLAQKADDNYYCALNNVTNNLQEAFAYLVSPYLDLDILRMEQRKNEDITEGVEIHE